MVTQWWCQNSSINSSVDGSRSTFGGPNICNKSTEPRANYALVHSRFMIENPQLGPHTSLLKLAGVFQYLLWHFLGLTFRLFLIIDLHTPFNHVLKNGICEHQHQLFCLFRRGRFACWSMSASSSLGLILEILSYPVCRRPFRIQAPLGIQGAWQPMSQRVQSVYLSSSLLMRRFRIRHLGWKLYVMVRPQAQWKMKWYFLTSETHFCDWS